MGSHAPMECWPTTITIAMTITAVTLSNNNSGCLSSGLDWFWPSYCDSSMISDLVRLQSAAHYMVLQYVLALPLSASFRAPESLTFDMHNCAPDKFEGSALTVFGSSETSALPSLGLCRERLQDTDLGYSPSDEDNLNNRFQEQLEAPGKDCESNVVHKAKAPDSQTVEQSHDMSTCEL